MLEWCVPILATHLCTASHGRSRRLAQRLSHAKGNRLVACRASKTPGALWPLLVSCQCDLYMGVQVFCDRHYGGINYPRGGVGRIGELLVEGLQERGGYIEYKANVSSPSCLYPGHPDVKSRLSLHVSLTESAEGYSTLRMENQKQAAHQT